MSYKTKTNNGKRLMICMNSKPETSKYYRGKECDNWTVVGHDATGVLYWKCTSAMVPPPDITSGYKSQGFPRGWQFRKEFVHEDGTVYHKGVEQPKLKGTLDATPIDNTKKKKLSKKEKEELKDQLLQQMVFVRGELSKAKWKKDIRSNQVQLRRIERKIKKLK